MKKLLIVVLGLSLTVGAMAQTGGSRKEKEENDKAMNDLKTHVRAQQAARHVVNHDLSHVQFGKALRDRKDVTDTHKMVDADSKRLKAHGVSHPVAKAKRQVKVEDDNHKDHI